MGPPMSEQASTSQESGMNHTPTEVREESVDCGFSFQRKLFMLLLHRGIANGYSFSLNVELTEPNKLDGLIFSFMKGNQMVYRVFQVKQKLDSTRHKITLGSLSSESDNDISLLKCFLYYRDSKEEEMFKRGIIEDITICTNINFTKEILKGLRNIKKIEAEDSILGLNSEIKVGPDRYKLTTDYIPRLKLKLKKYLVNKNQREPTEDEMRQFLDHLVLAVNWPNEDELDKIIKREIGMKLYKPNAENVYDKVFLELISEWLQGKGDQMFFTPEEGKELYVALQRKFSICYNFREPVKSFTGRESEIAQLHKLLKSDHEGSQYVCITGIAGVGKSELVRNYISNHREEYCCNIVWFDTKKKGYLEESIRRLATNNLGINPQKADGKDKEISDIIEEVYKFFSDVKSLFVFDDSVMYEAEKEADPDVVKFLPISPCSISRPHILVTSIHQQWPQCIKVLKLDVFEEEEAIRFIKSTLECGGDDFESMKTLVNKLQFYPLALQQVVAYINNEKVSVQDYIEKYKEADVPSFHIPPAYNDVFTRTVFTTCDITLKAIAQKEYGNEAIDIFNALAYMLEEQIPISICSGLINDGGALTPAISLLNQYSLVTLENEKLSIHGLFQEITRLRLAREGMEMETLKNCLIIFIDKLTGENLDHALSVWNHAFKYDELTKNFSMLSTYINRELVKRCRFRESLSFGEEVCKRLMSISFDSKVIRAVLEHMNCIGGALASPGQYDIAFKKFLDVLCSCMKVRDPSKHPSVLIIKSNIASFYHKKGEYKEALEQYKEILNIENTVLGEHHTSTLKTKMNMAATLEEMGFLFESMSLKQEVQNTTSESNPDSLETQINFAVECIAKGRYNKALNILENVLRLQETHLDPNHPTILVIKHNISEALRQLGKPKEAMQYMKEILEIQNAALGENHPDVLTIQCSIAALLRAQKRYNEALKMYIEVYAKQKEILGIDHPDTLETLFSRGLLCHDLANHQESDKIFQDVLVKFKVAFGREHPITLNVRAAIADVHIRKGDYNEALKEFKDIFELQEAKLGPTHPQVLTTKYKIGRVLFDKGEYDQALEIYEEVSNYRKTLFGNEHPDTLGIMSDVSNLHFKMGNYDKAISDYQKILDIQNATLGSNDIDTLNTMYNLATIYGHTRKFDPALKLYYELLEGRRQVLGEDHPDTLKVSSSIAELYFGKADYDKALEKLQEVLILQKKIYGESHPQIRTVKHKIGIVEDIKEQHEALQSSFNDFEKLDLSVDNTMEVFEIYMKVLNIEKTIEEGLESRNYTPPRAEPLKSLKETLEKFMSNRGFPYETALEGMIESGGINARAAIRSGSLSELENLLKVGIDVNSTDTKLWTLLHHAVNSGNIEMVKLLLKRRADIFRVNNKGKTCLHIAALKGNIDIVKLLLEQAGPDNVQGFVNHQTKVSLLAPVHTAAEKGFLDIVMCLMSNGAIYNIRNSEGRTPLDLTYEEEIRDLLLAVDSIFEDVRNGRTRSIGILKGLVPDWFAVMTNVRNDGGLTLLQLSIVNKHKPISRKLLEIMKGQTCNV